MAKTEEPAKVDLTKSTALVLRGGAGKAVETNERGAVKLGAAKHRSIKRLKIIQGTTEGDLRKKYGVGSVVIQPEGLLIAKGDGADGVSTPFLATPVGVFTTYQRRSDYNDKNSRWILEETWDSKSDLARRCANPDASKQAYGGGEFNYTFCVCINVVLLILNTEGVGATAVASFAMGDYYTGKDLCTALDDRASQGLPIYRNRIEFVTVGEDNDKGHWQRLDFSEPMNGELGYLDPSDKIDAQIIEAAKAQFQMLKRVRDANLLEFDNSEAKSGSRSEVIDTETGEVLNV